MPYRTTFFLLLVSLTFITLGPLPVHHHSASAQSDCALPSFNNPPTRFAMREGVRYMLAVLPLGATPLSEAQFVVPYSLGSGSTNLPDVRLVMDGAFDVIPIRSLIGVAPGRYYSINVNSYASSLTIYLQPNCPTGVTVSHTITLASQGASPTCAYPSFSTPKESESGTFSLLTTGDFNGDGRSDVAALAQINTSSSYFHRLVTLLGQADGSLKTVGNLDLPGYAVSLIAADFTRDGKADLALSYHDVINTRALRTSGITILTGAGDGTFSLNRSYDMGNGYLASGDFNKDGHPDLAVTERLIPSYRLRILLNNGQGQFTEGPTPQSGNTTTESGLHIVVAHINNDDNLDIITTGESFTERPLYQFNGNGQGGFHSVICQLPGQGSPGALGAYIYSADFNGDNRLDAAVFDSNSSWLRLYSGETQLYAAYIDDVNVGNLAAADFNQDGKADLLVNGSRLFTSGTPAPFCAAPNYAFRPLGLFGAVGDINNDGRPDLIGRGSSGFGLRVYLNTSNITGGITAVSAASFALGTIRSFPYVAPEQIVAAFGTNMATSTATASTTPLPTALAGTQVRIRDRLNGEYLAPLFFVSPGQVNFLVPVNVDLSDAQITITNGNGVSSAGYATIFPLAPGLFAANANGRGIAAAQVLRVLANGAQRYENVAQFDAATNRFVPVPIDLSNANEQVFLVLYGTGYRRRTALSDITSTVGGVACETLYAGAQGQLAGLDQINLRLPRTLIGRGEVEVIVKVVGVYENTVSVTIK